MDAESLRDLQRREKMSPYLQELDKGFYRELRKFLGGILQEIKSSGRADTSKLALKIAEYENLKTIVNDLYETRERKIVSNALYYVKSGDELDTKNLTSEEEEVLRGIVRLLREKRGKVLEKMLGEEGGEGEEEGEEKGKKLREKEDEKEEKVEQRKKAVKREEMGKDKAELKGYVTVRILKDLPSIVGIDGKVYGAFKKEDVVTLPRANAETLINRGAAEKIDLGKVYI